MSFFHPKSSAKIAKQGLDEQIVRAKNDLYQAEKELTVIDAAIEQIVGRDYEEEIIHLIKEKEFLEQDLLQNPQSKELKKQLKETTKSVSVLEKESEESEPKLEQLEKKKLKVADKIESLEREISTLGIGPKPK